MNALLFSTIIYAYLSLVKVVQDETVIKRTTT